MLKRRFLWKDSFDFGWGWCPSWMENGDPTVGFGAAHDTLEHFPRCIGGFEGEMMAFGAMHVVRREISWNNGDIYDNQASDIQNFLGNVVGGDHQTIRCPGAFNTRNLIFDADFMEAAIARGIKEFCEEQAWERQTAQEVRDKLPPEPVRRMLGWIVKGQRKALKRYDQWQLSPGELAWMFGEIRDEFDRIAKRNGDIGEHIDVRVDFDRRRVTVDRDYDFGTGY